MIDYFKINETDSIDLYKIELIRILPDKLCVFSFGMGYVVDEMYAESFLERMKMIESASQQAGQYVSV